MKKLTFSLAALVALTLMVSSCKKDNDNPTPTPSGPQNKTKTELLSANNWKTISMMSDGYDFYTIMDDCEKDNFIKINANGSYVEDEGLTKCDPSDPQTKSGLWKFINNESALVIDAEDTLSIVKLTADTLRMSTSFIDDEGESKTVVTTLLKKK